MSKTVIAMIGAGSTVFAKHLIGDVLSYPELQGCEIRLHDIDPHRLDLSEQVAKRIADQLGAKPTIVATTDRSRALDGADYAFSMIQVAGYRPGTTTDFEIPSRYGLRQTIGDTLGIGGIMRALRTIPVMLDIVHDMERLCPDVLHMNYVNPMAMVTWALNRASSIRTVGLCHSVQGTARELAHDLDIPIDEIDYLAAGINHMAFYLKFERDGRDLRPDLLKVHQEGRVPDHNRVRYDAFRRLGYFVTESSEHFAEYVPWYLKGHRPDLVERYNIPLDEYPGRCQVYEVAWEFIEEELEDPGRHSPEALRQAIEARDIDVMPGSIDYTVREFGSLHEVHRSIEYGSTIVHAIETDQPAVIYGNVLNEGLIDGLPRGCCVEVPCLVDANGVQPTVIGSMPPQLTALMRTNVNVQELTVEAALSGRRDHVLHAALLDPRTAAELAPDEIESMVNDLLEAHRDWLPEDLLAPVDANTAAGSPTLEPTAASK